MVQEVDVDSVFVVLGADWGDGGDGIGGFSPSTALHAGAVVYQEYGVEVAEEGIL